MIKFTSYMHSVCLSVFAVRVEKFCILTSYCESPFDKTDLFKPVAKPAVKKEYYRVLYEFDPRNPDEMALEEGDIVEVRLFK